MKEKKVKEKKTEEKEERKCAKLSLGVAILLIFILFLAISLFGCWYFNHVVNNSGVVIGKTYIDLVKIKS